MLAVSGNSVWFASSTCLWRTADDGAHWARYPLHSPGKGYGLAGVAAANSGNVAFLWGAAQGMYRTVMKVQLSFNGGRTQEQTRKSPPSQGDVAAFAVTPGRFGVISVAVVTPGLDNVYRSASLGKTWTTYRVPGTSGGTMLNSLEFMSPTAGCFVAGNPGARAI